MALLTWVVAAQASIWLVTGALVIYGVGLGLASAQLTSTVRGDIPEESSGSGSATQSTVRQLGSALGAAMSRTIPDAMASVGGVPADVRDGLAEATRSSAGSVIGRLREASPDDPLVAPLGSARNAMVDPLSAGFARSAAWSIGFSALFLVLGLLGSVMVRREARGRR